MVPTPGRGPLAPSEVDRLDLEVVAALLGLDRGRMSFDADWERMRRARIEAARDGRAVTWSDLDGMP